MPMSSLDGNTFTQHPSHERLSKPPLVEALLDFRFNTDTPLTEEMLKRLGLLFEDFSSVESINAQVIRFQVRPDGQTTPIDGDSQAQDMIQYRYRNPKTNEYIQIGNGILTVNARNYQGFENFYSLIEKIIGIYQKVVKITGYRRLALKYINHISSEISPNHAFKWLANIPQEWGQKTPIQNFQQVTLKVNGDFQNVTIAYPQVNYETRENIMLLDIDHFLDFNLPVMPNSEALLSWINNAHEEVHKTFISAISEDYYKELK